VQVLDVLVGVGVAVACVALYVGTRRRRAQASGRGDALPGVAATGAVPREPAAAEVRGDDLPDTEAGRLIGVFGGRENIVTLDACVTRLSIEVADLSKVDKPALQKLGAAGVLEVGRTVQAIVGPRADALKSEMQKLM
jgi:PTS system N-acetylglucosamine-specific IIC component